MRSSRGRAGSFPTAILLLTLGAGLLSTGIDLLEDHSAPRLSADHSESAGRPYHLIRYQASKSSPCNVCYFQKLLGQGLFPAGQFAFVADTSVSSANIPSVTVARAEFNTEVNRGPPHSS